MSTKTSHFLCNRSTCLVHCIVTYPSVSNLTPPPHPNTHTRTHTVNPHPPMHTCMHTRTHAHAHTHMHSGTSHSHLLSAGLEYLLFIQSSYSLLKKEKKRKKNPFAYPSHKWPTGKTMLDSCRNLLTIKDETSSCLFVTQNCNGLVCNTCFLIACYLSVPIIIIIKVFIKSVQLVRSVTSCPEVSPPVLKCYLLSLSVNSCPNSQSQVSPHQWPLSVCSF